MMHHTNSYTESNKSQLNLFYIQSERKKIQTQPIMLIYSFYHSEIRKEENIGRKFTDTVKSQV